MPTRDHYDAGIPSWTDLSTPDVDAAKTFYTQLFGWETEDIHGEDGDLIYTMFRRDGRAVAGVGGQTEESAGAPATWTTYVATDDADATAKRVTAAGGSVLVEPMDVMESGRMAIFQDPAGAVVATWQARRHIGAELVNEAGGPSWNELLTGDREGAKRFYGEVFDWAFEDMEMPTGPYTVAQVGDGPVAGVMDRPQEMPDDIPDHWLSYFAVEDTDAVVAAAAEAGATVLLEPTTVEGVGRIATLADPQGAPFSVMQYPEGDRS